MPTLGINGRFTVYGAGLEPMSALANSTFDRAGAANGGSPPTAALCSLRCYVVNGRTPDDRLMAPRVGLGPQSDLGINLQPISRASDLVAKQPKLSASGALDSAISVDEFAPPD